MIWDFVPIFTLRTQPKFRLPAVFICLWFREWPWNGQMAREIETGLGAAYPCEKLEHLWICIKCRTSGNSYNL